MRPHQLILVALLAFGGCATKRVKELLSTPLDDVVNHDLLEGMGYTIHELPAQSYDPDLVKFVYQFIADAQERKFAITPESQAKLRRIEFVDELSLGKGAGVIASCNRYYVFQTTVAGDKKELNWNTIEVLRTAAKRYAGTSTVLYREIMYHELFHCFLNKGHLPPGYAGIMSPTFVRGDTRADEDWKGLVDDLFAKDMLDLIPNVD